MLLENAARQQKRICTQCRLADVVLHLNASGESLGNKQYLCSSAADYKQCFSMGFRTFNLEAFIRSRLLKLDNLETASGLSDKEKKHYGS
jgi:hypothetical protein